MSILELSSGLHEGIPANVYHERHLVDSARGSGEGEKESGDMTMMAMKLSLREPISRQLWASMPYDMRRVLVFAGKVGFHQGLPVVHDECTLGILRDLERAIAEESGS